VDLRLNEDELNICVQCGLCLPFCPTYRVTGEESKSPRGRIQLMREVQLHDAPLNDEVVDSFATCVQCRACEPACPSSVPYGHLMERVRETLNDEGNGSPTWLKLGFKSLNNPALLRAGSSVLALAQRAKLVPKQLGLGELPLTREPLQTTGTDVFFFTGCVMDAWQRDVHQAGQRVLEAAGFGVTPTGDMAPCCGALHAHAGLGNDYRSMARDVVTALTVEDDGGSPDRPVVTDSAGCGAAMKDYGHLLGAHWAEEFSGRVFDIHEFLAPHLDKLPEVEPLNLKVAIQDPCHLRHVQRVHEATRDLLRPFVRELVELDDEGMCCGAGGAYSVLEAELSRKIRDRKVEAIERAAPDVVASANPGCSMHLGAVGIPTIHPMQLVARALGYTSQDGRTPPE
jgi:glycolate oxidase iron-sulfur subunit